MPDQPPEQPGTRQAQKAERRARLLGAAKSLFTQHGFHAVSLGDLGSGAGISAPAVYRHFASKEAVLSELLVGISEHLSTGGAAVVAEGGDDALERLVDFHVDFAMSEPELIRIQDRDFSALPVEARATVRRLQRHYIDLWCSELRGRHELGPDQRLGADSRLDSHSRLGADEAEVRVRAVFGLINSTPHLGSRLSAGTTRRQLTLSALGALGVG